MADYTTNLGLEKIEPGTKPYYEKEWSNLDKIDANNPKHNFTATADPTPTNDSSEGYGVGSVWINTSTKTIFKCVDATTGNADWDEVTKIDLSNVPDATILDKVKNVDGSGSGLDADLLDGHDSSYFLPTTGKAADSDKLDGEDSTRFIPSSIYSYDQGCLIQTDIPAASNKMFTLAIKGNGYLENTINIIVQGYNYQSGDDIIHLDGFAIDLNFNINVFNYNGYLYFWFKQTNVTQSFIAYCFSTMDDAYNHITNITNAAMPTSGVTRLHTVVPKQVWNSGNDGSGSGLDADLVRGLKAIGQQTITSSSGSATIDWNAGTNAIITLTENTTLTFTNPTSPCHLQLEVAQNSTGGYTLTLPTIKWVGGVSPALSTAANNISVISLYFDGTNYLGISSDSFA